MPAKHIQICPKCGQRNDVFVKDSIPQMGKRFRYTCPKCKELVDFAFPAGEMVDSIPGGALVAEPT